MLPPELVALRGNFSAAQMSIKGVPGSLIVRRSLLMGSLAATVGAPAIVQAQADWPKGPDNDSDILAAAHEAAASDGLLICALGQRRW